MGSTALKLGMVGGGRGAFIGAVHRTAAALDGAFVLTAGCLASTPEKALASGRDLGLAPDRNYPTWRAMLEGEASRPRGERLDAVSIVTPNSTHAEVALAFVSAGIHVVCDKPLTTTLANARALAAAVARTGVVFGVTYNYSAYPMVREARELVRAGRLGVIRTVGVEYTQGWLASALETGGQKQAAWRTDPALSGAGGAIGDIGTHAEQLVRWITGLEVESVCADVTTFVPGRRVDDDASVLLRFASRDGVAARGVLRASQVCVGHENDLRVRVHGTLGSLSWRQEEPNELIVRTEGEPERVLRRGNAYLSAAAAGATRLPPGHPEAFFEAFANVYGGVRAAILAGEGGTGAGLRHGFPGVLDGARGVAFVEAVLTSAGAGSVWTPVSSVEG